MFLLTGGVTKAGPFYFCEKKDVPLAVSKLLFQLFQFATGIQCSDILCFNRDVLGW